MPASAAFLPLLLCAGFAAAACGGPREGSPGLSGVAPVVVQPSAGPADPLRKAAAPDLDAVTRVARRYYALLDDLRRRMRAAPLARLMAPGCPCRAQVRAIQRAIRRGEHYTDRVRVVTLVPHLDRSDLADVFVSYDVTDGGLVDDLGNRVAPAITVRDVHRQLMIRRTGGRWLIERVLAV